MDDMTTLHLDRLTEEYKINVLKKHLQHAKVNLALINEKLGKYEEPEIPLAEPVTQPAMQPEPDHTNVPSINYSKHKESVKWIEEYAVEDLGISYLQLMVAAARYVDFGDLLAVLGATNTVTTDPEFWLHYEILRGKTYTKGDGNFFVPECR